MSEASNVDSIEDLEIGKSHCHHKKKKEKKKTRGPVPANEADIDF